MFTDFARKSLVTFLAKHRLIDFDYKPANIFCDEKGKTTHFDAECIFSPAQYARCCIKGGNKEFCEIIGTLYYMSPSRLKGSAGDFSDLIFSFGILFAEIASGKHPFLSDLQNAPVAQLLYSIFQRTFVLKKFLIFAKNSCNGYLELSLTSV